MAAKSKIGVERQVHPMHNLKTYAGRFVKNYASRFVKNESGAELIEWAIGVAIAGILIAAAFSIANTMNNELTTTETELKDAFGKKGGGSGGGGGDDGE